jgi:hypothetical protein
MAADKPFPIFPVLKTVTLAQLERSIRAGSSQGTPLQTITHHPDGRIVLAFSGDAEDVEFVNPWDVPSSGGRNSWD